MGNIDLGAWGARRASFATRGVPAYAGISGGRTSAMMAALAGEDVGLIFQNTGREHSNTLDFLNELDNALGHRLVWLEFRMPKVKGARPREFEFAVVNYRTADRSGGPFDGFMQALADYRATRDLAPVAPWALGRLCTAYMKQRVKERYVRSLGVIDYDYFVGLRADEPQRVSKLKARDTKSLTFRMPLATEGIVKSDVLSFWKSQPFDLELEERQGNCTGCFLKDQGDLARVLQEAETDANWWISIQERYDNFGGANFPGYRQLLHEGPIRQSIEASLRGRQEPTNDGSLEDRRFKLVVLQEKRRIKGEIETFSCNCEQAFEDDDGEVAA